MPQTVNLWERLALIALFAVGAWLRFQNIGDIEYNIDQVYPIWQAIQTLDTGALPLVGQGTSALFANPPLTGYFFVPFVAMGRHPLMAYAVTLTLNTFAIWLAYRALRWLVGTRPALVGAALFAANPWIIEDSRRAWVQSLAPFFVCLIFWALAPALTGQTRHPARRTLIALVGLALFAHTYLLAYALVAPVALLAVVFWRRVPRRALIVGAAFFGLLMALYGVGLARDWQNTADRAEAFASGDARLSDEALRHALRLVTGWDYASARPSNSDAGTRSALSDIAHWIWTAGLAVGIGKAVFLILSRSESGAAADAPLILLIWFLMPVLMMSYVSRVAHPFYLLLTIPAGHGLAAWGVFSLREIKVEWGRLPRRAFPIAIVGLLVFTAAINGLNAARFAQNTAAYPGEDLPETLPLEEASALGARLKAAGAPELGVFSLMDEWMPVTLVGRDFRTDFTGTYGRAMIIPPQGALYVLFQQPGADPPLTPPFGQQVGAPLALDDGTRIMIWRVMPDDGRIAHPADIPSDIDVSYIGYTLNGDLAPGEPATLVTFWRVEALHPDRGIWSFLPVAHVFDAAGAQVASDQGHAVSGLTWAVGDVIAQPLALTLPEDATPSFEIQLSLFDPVRAREDGAVGINAVFRVESGDSEPEYTAAFWLDLAR